MSLARIVEHFHKLGPLDSKHIDADVLGQARTADLALATEKTARQPGRASRARPTSPPSTAFWT